MRAIGEVILHLVIEFTMKNAFIKLNDLIPTAYHRWLQSESKKKKNFFFFKAKRELD